MKRALGSVIAVVLLGDLILTAQEYSEPHLSSKILTEYREPVKSDIPPVSLPGILGAKMPYLVSLQRPVSTLVIPTTTTPPTTTTVTVPAPRQRVRVRARVAKVVTTTTVVSSIVVESTAKVESESGPSDFLSSEASWYGPGFMGHGTACGQKLTPELIGVAHKTLPCGTIVKFRYNGREVDAPVVDRGPFVRGRMWDLTQALCQAIGHCFTGSIEYRMV